MPLTSGARFADFRIVRLIGVGGMGEVYLVEHPRLPRREALKVLPLAMSADAEFRTRFNREAEIAATLFHPNIVGVHDRGEFNGQLWISMDYVDGTDGARLMRDMYPTGLPPAEVAAIVSAVAEALDYAHQNGLLHRDVKPSNILVARPFSAQRRVLLADFGISRWIADNSGFTQTNTALGTVSYAAPEQLTASRLDGRTDQYALAATAYHLLTGSPPFSDPNPAVVVGQHLASVPPALGAIHPALSGLDPVMQRALAKQPADRFPTCRAFADAFAAHSAPGGAATTAFPPTGAPAPVPRVPTAVLPAPESPRTPAPPPVRPVGIPRWAITVAVVAVALILAGVVLAVRPWRSTEATPPAPATVSTVPTKSDAGKPSGAISFGNMKALVQAYYAELPGNPGEAWTKLDTEYQQRTGWEDYLAFWSTIRAVTVMSVRPRDADSVIASIRYVGNDGRVSTEDRWFRLVSNGTGPLIGDSDIAG